MATGRDRGQSVMDQLKLVALVVVALIVARLTFAWLRSPTRRGAPAGERDGLALASALLVGLSAALCAAFFLGLFEPRV